MITKSVLLVGTDDRLLRQLRSLLESRRIDTFEAPDLESAGELVRKRRFDLALVDGAVLAVVPDEPDPRNGRSAPRWPEVPALVLIESGDPDAERRALRNGFDGYLAKPIQTRTFLITVHRQLVRAEGIHADRTMGAPKKRVLLAGASEDLAGCEKALREHGFETETVAWSDSAIVEAAQRGADLAVIDPGPGGGDLAPLKALKSGSEPAAPPVLMLIGLEDQDGRAAGLEAGAEEFLSKPVRAIELLTRVRILFERRGSVRRRSGDSVHATDGGTAETAAGARSGNGDQPVVLLVDPHEREARILQASLRDLPVRIEAVQSGEKALLFAQTKRVDAVLLDLLLPDLDGLEVCRRLKENAGDVDLPVVVTTCLDEKSIRVRCKALGADDYFVKPIPAAELRARVEALLERKSKADRRERLLRTAMDAAIIDWLTGLYAPGYFRTALALESRRSERHGYPVSLLLLDVDDFRLYNDLLGPKAGDLLLQELAHLVRGTIREVDLAARSGDDEFAVVLPDCDRAGAFQVARRIHAAVENRRFFHDAYAATAGITLSMGIAVFPTDAPNAGELVRKAGQMLLRAKRKGKDRICL